MKKSRKALNCRLKLVWLTESFVLIYKNPLINKQYLLALASDIH